MCHHLEGTASLTKKSCQKNVPLESNLIFFRSTANQVERNKLNDPRKKQSDRFRIWETLQNNWPDLFIKSMPLKS